MIMIKITVLIAATLGIAHANIPSSEATYTPPKPFSTGFYLGAELGDSHENHKYRESKTEGTYGSGVFFKSKGTKNRNSFLPGLFAGYRHVICPLFLGFELAVNYNGTKSKITFMGLNNEKGVHSVTTKYNFIPAVVLGIPISAMNGVMVYGKLGCDFRKYQHKIVELVASGPTMGLVKMSKSSSKSTSLLVLGLGMECALNETISSRFEFIHSFGKHINFKMSNNTIFDNIYRTSIKPSATVFKIGFFVKIKN